MGNIVSSNLKFDLVSNKYDADILLKMAEKRDMYLEECFDDTVNSIARFNMTYMPNQISLRDINYAQSFIEMIIEYIPRRLQIDLSTVHIIQLMPTADGGMPHTRPESIICLPDISQLFSKITLIHELWHIHQRIYKDLWMKVFNRLGWSLWNGKLPEQLDNHRRFNPDTIDCPFWIFQNTWIPVPIFRDITHPKVNDVDIWFFNPHKHYHVKQIPPEISEYFSNLPLNAYEHPREITAYMLSDPDKYVNSTAFKHLLESIGETSVITSASKVKYQYNKL